MKRGGRLKRYTRLVSRTPLRNKKKLRPAGSGGGGVPGGGVPAGGAVSEGWLSRPQARGHRVEPDLAAVVRERSGGRCEIWIEGCWGDAREKSHRIARGAGGRHGAAKRESDRPSNILDSCTFCHLVITDHAWTVDAKRHGWVLKDRQDPSRCEVYRRREWVYLDDVGGVRAFSEAKR